MLKSNDIYKTINLGKATYDNALIGKTDVALAMLALREQVATTNLTKEQKQLFFETAIPMAESEYKKNPHFAGLPTYIADSYKFKGDTTQAILVMEDFCAKHPNSPTSWIDFGLLLLDLGKNKEAIAAFEKTAKDNPKSMIPQVYKLYAYGKMKDTLLFLNTISNITWKDRVLYQDQIIKAFIQSNQIPLYFQYIKSCPNKAEFLNTNSYLQWAYLALSVGNAIEYRYAWHQYVENIKLKRKLSNIEKLQLDETISQAIENQLEVPKVLEIIDKFGE
jgi:tetratricopeptide (TPR) repeat protein